MTTDATPGSAPAVRRAYVDTPYGQLHVAECGAGRPIVFLHQTPRSWTEYLHVLPIVGRRARAIALDTIGFGQSARPAHDSIETYADAALAAVTALGLSEVLLVGHHTGAVIALEAATRAPDRVPDLVLSAMPLVTPQRRERMRGRPPVDHVESTLDGTHLTELWQRRRNFYPIGHEADLTRFVVDALQIPDRLEAGHAAVNDYEMLPRLRSLRSRTLLLCGADDPFSLPDQAALAKRLRCRLQVIEGAGVCLPEQRSTRFAEEVLAFAGAHQSCTVPSASRTNGR